MAHKRLGEMLIDAGYITPEKLDLALNVQKRTQERLGQIIARLGFITPEELAQTIAKQYGMRYVGLEQLKMVEIDIEAIEALTLDFARVNVMLPVLRTSSCSVGPATVNGRPVDKEEKGSLKSGSPKGLFLDRLRGSITVMLILAGSTLKAPGLDGTRA